MKDDAYPFWLVLVAFALGFFCGAMAILQATGAL